MIAVTVIIVAEALDTLYPLNSLKLWDKALKSCRVCLAKGRPSERKPRDFPQVCLKKVPRH